MSPERRRRLTLVAMTASVSLVFFDQTVVATALPAIQADTGLSDAALHWVVDAYLVALAAFVVIGGRIGDRFGRRLAFVVGAGVFSTGSIASGVAWEPTLMITGRVMQGVGAALMQPNGFAIVGAAYGDERRGRAIGVLIGVSSLFLALGPLAGGLLVEGPGWRPIFLIAPVVALASAALALAVVPEWREGRARALDVPGGLLLAAALLALVLPVTQGEEWGWTGARTLALLVACGLLLAAFAWRELRTPQPMLDLRLLRRPALSAPVAAGFACQFTVLAVTVYTAIYLQRGLGESAVMAGLLFLPAVVPVVLAPAAGWLADARGPRLPMVAGSALIALGLLALGIAARERDLLMVAGALGLIGLGRPLVLTPMNTAVMDAVEASERAVAAGVASAARFVGGAIGVAAAGAVVAAVEAEAPGPLVPATVGPETDRAYAATLEGDDEAAALTAALPPDAAEAVRTAASDALVDAFSTAMTVSAAVAVLGLVAALLVPRGRAADRAAATRPALTPSVRPRQGGPA